MLAQRVTVSFNAMYFSLGLTRQTNQSLCLPEKLVEYNEA